jgi:hypothetical protein
MLSYESNSMINDSTTTTITNEPDITTINEPTTTTTTTTLETISTIFDTETTSPSLIESTHTHTTDITTTTTTTTTSSTLLQIPLVTPQLVNFKNHGHFTIKLIIYTNRPYYTILLTKQIGKKQLTNLISLIPKQHEQQQQQPLNKLLGKTRYIIKRKDIQIINDQSIYFNQDEQLPIFINEFNQPNPIIQLSSKLIPLNIKYKMRLQDYTKTSIRMIYKKNSRSRNSKNKIIYCYRYRI